MYNDNEKNSNSTLQLPFEVITEDGEVPTTVIEKNPIPLPPEKPLETTKKKRSKIGNIIQIILLFFFGSIFVVAAIHLGINYWNKLQGGQIYGDMADEFSVFDPSNSIIYREHTLPASDLPLQSLDNRITSGITDASQGSTQSSERLSAIRETLNTLKAKNSDIYGWIFVEGTDINYPVLRGTDNSYYLTHSYEKKYLAIGSIFADCQVQDNITDNRNTVFYGHNVMTNVSGSSMFHDVEKFLKKDFFDSARIYVYTLDGIYVYQPFSIYPTISDYEYFKVIYENETEYAHYLSEYKNNSKLPSDINVDASDKILTLSTCTNGAQNARYALHAVLVELIEE